MKRITKYPNSTVVKLHNRKVAVFRPDENREGFQLEFHTLTRSDEFRSGHNRLKDKITVTGLRLSVEAAKALYAALHRELLEHHKQTIETR